MYVHVARCMLLRKWPAEFEWVARPLNTSAPVKPLTGRKIRLWLYWAAKGHKNVRISKELKSGSEAQCAIVSHCHWQKMWNVYLLSKILQKKKLNSFSYTCYHHCSHLKQKCFKWWVTLLQWPKYKPFSITSWAWLSTAFFYKSNEKNRLIRSDKVYS